MTGTVGYTGSLKTIIDGKAPLSSPAFTGTPTIGGAAVAKTSDIAAAISGIVGAAPSVLDTLKEIDDQLAADEGSAAALAAAVAGKEPAGLSTTTQSSLAATYASKAAAVFDTYRPVATRTFRGGTGSLVASVGGTSRTTHTAPFACHALRVGYGNFYYSFNGQTIDGPNPVSYKLAVEVGGVIYPAHGSAGQRTVTVDPGGTAWFDLDIDLPAGTLFALRPYVSVTSGSWVTTVNSSGNTDGEGFVSVDSADSGTIAQSDSYLAGPVAVLGKLTAAAPSLLGVGDSITFGQGDVAYGEGKKGYFARAVGQTLPWANLGIMSETATHFLSQPGHFRRIPSNFTHAIEAYGRNDLTAAGSFASITADRIAIWRMLATRGMKIRASTTTPSATSTDQYATTTNQTIATGGSNPVRVQVNDWLRAGAPLDPATFAAVAAGTSGALLAGQAGHPLAGVDDLADTVETARNSGLWKVGTSSRSITDVNAPAGNYNVFSSSANFTAADLGKLLVIPGAGPSGSTYYGPIGTIVNAGFVQIDGNYGSTISTTVNPGTAQLIDVFTYDGTHPSPTGAAAMAAALTVPTSA